MATLNNSLKGSLSITLQGYRTMLERQFGLSNIKVVINDSSKEDSKRTSQEAPSYPRSKLVIQEVRAYKDVANGHATARHGWFNPNNDVTNSTTLKYYLWPVAIGTELSVSISDPVETMIMAEKFIVAAMSNALNFKINLSHNVSVMVRAEVPDTVSIPLAEADNTENPGANSLNFQVALYSWIGFTKDVGRVSGTVEHNAVTK